ncbi:hypothetical protein KI387_003103, partial [Taxus chinensis]
MNIADADAGTKEQQEAVDSFEGEASKNTAPQVADVSHLHVNFKKILALKGKACAKMENHMESDKYGGKNGASASAPTEELRYRRENEVSNLDISLLPAVERLEIFRSVPKQTVEKNTLAEKSPFGSFGPLKWEGVSPAANANVFRSPFPQSKTQSDLNQLTIFYRGTVSVYSVTPDLAKAIMLSANQKNIALCPTPSTICHTGYIQPALSPKA